MTVTVFTDPLGTIAALIEHPGALSYADGGAQTARAAATAAIAAFIDRPHAEVRRRVSLAAAKPGQTIYALDLARTDA